MEPKKYQGTAKTSGRRPGGKGGEAQELETLELVGTMSRGLAHDLQSLLTPISTYLQLSQRDDVAEERLRLLLPIALRNLESIQAFIRQARYFTEHLHPQMRPCRLDILLGRAVELAEAEWREKKLKVFVEAPETLALELDEVLILRLVLNLLENSIHASKPGSTITISAEVLSANAGKTRKQEARVRIKDAGKGISTEQLHRILSNPPAPSRDQAGGGIGLGLAICRKIADLHGGRLIFKTGRNKGMTVDVILPLRQKK